jgi:phosphoribosylanthranilate isomerase
LSLLIKICGVTREADVSAAVEAGSDAVGFVFHEASRRNLTPARAAKLSHRMPSDMLRVAVTLNPSQELVERVLDEFVPDVWQSDFEDFAAIRIPGDIERWPVLRTGGRAPVKLPHTLLFDAAVSGNGMQADWKTAAVLARRSLLIIGGGLNASTVASAIEKVRPIGVDVSSGVERDAGVKDGNLIREFVAAARAADRNVDS